MGNGMSFILNYTMWLSAAYVAPNLNSSKRAKFRQVLSIRPRSPFSLSLILCAPSQLDHLPSTSSCHPSRPTNLHPSNLRATCGVQSRTRFTTRAIASNRRAIALNRRASNWSIDWSKTFADFLDPVVGSKIEELRDAMTGDDGTVGARSTGSWTHAVGLRTQGACSVSYALSALQRRTTNQCQRCVVVL